MVASPKAWDGARVEGAGSVVRDAADCRALLAALGIERAHVVGASYSGAVALQLAADAPERTHPESAGAAPDTCLECGRVPRGERPAAVDPRVRGSAAALDEFLTIVLGPDWRTDIEQAVPGTGTQMQRDAATFFDTDLPALLAWRFGTADARRITCPVLHVGGTDSGPWFAEVRELVLNWLPHAEDVVIAGAGHSLAITHPSDVADALVAFLRRHPI